MAEAFGCQICGLDMAAARVRTPSEPPSAAWGWRGVNYVGFSKFLDYQGREFPDGWCRECTTADRTPAQIRTAEYANLWPEDEDEDEDDAEWLPDDCSQSDSEPLEYDSDAQVSDGSSAGSLSGELDQDRDGDNDERSWRDATSTRYPLSDMYIPPLPERLPHGTWRDGLIFSRGPDGLQARETMTSAFEESRAPPEHIASRSCQTLQGINGHILGVAEMKNCRNHRFLMPKPWDWVSTEATDGLLEDGNVFYLTGESSGSDHFMYRYFYPARHGLSQTIVECDYLNLDPPYDVVKPLPVHSYCLDMYAKASYRRHGLVDLDGLYLWRKIQRRTKDYGLGELSARWRPEVQRGCRELDDPWQYHPGDEWLFANPVEIEGIQDALASCMSRSIGQDAVCTPRPRLLALPAEIIIHILTFVDISDVSAVASTCRRLYDMSQPCFKAYVTENMSWLWELFQGGCYPPSPDWPPTWDPLCPPGLTPPVLPAGLESKEDEDERWARIIADDPEMEELGDAIRALNDARREQIFGPYRAKQEASLREWNDFRAGVETWIRRLPDPPGAGAGAGRDEAQSPDWDWLRVWRMFKPDSTRFPGVRNRAGIWRDCEQILDLVDRGNEAGGMGAERNAMVEKLSSVEYWTEIHGS